MVYGALSTAHLARAGAFGATFEDSFATWTSLCCIAAGLACTPALRTAEREPPARARESTFLLLLMGAASWAWHAGQAMLPTRRRTCWTCFGWLLVTSPTRAWWSVAPFVGLGLRDWRWLRKARRRRYA